MAGSAGFSNVSSRDTPPSVDEATNNMKLASGQQELAYTSFVCQVSTNTLSGTNCRRGTSAKSSALEATTGVPFPRSGGMCTKFPTQINLRKAATNSTSVSLEPRKGRTAAEGKEFAQLSKKVGNETDLGAIIKLAEQTIWPNGQSSNSASKDILTLDYSGLEKIT
jgi:hypothetical protein